MAKPRPRRDCIRGDAEIHARGTCARAGRAARRCRNVSGIGRLGALLDAEPSASLLQLIRASVLENPRIMSLVLLCSRQVNHHCEGMFRKMPAE
jgi:hypothetical protein